MLELYSAYRTRDDLMKLLEELIKHLVRQMKNYQDNTNLLKQNWLKIDFEDFLNKKTGLNFTDTQEAWLKKAQEVGVEHSFSSASKEKLADEIFKKLRGEIKAPTFIINQPVAISPLAKQNSQEPSKTLRF